MGIMGSLRVSNFSLVWLTYTALYGSRAKNAGALTAGAGATVRIINASSRPRSCRR
jgi:hypothetical protein